MVLSTTARIELLKHLAVWLEDAPVKTAEHRRTVEDIEKSVRRRWIREKESALITTDSRNGKAVPINLKDGRKRIRIATNRAGHHRRLQIPLDSCFGDAPDDSALYACDF